MKAVTKVTDKNPIKRDYAYYEKNGVRIGNRVISMDQFKEAIKSIIRPYNPVTHWRMKNGEWIALKDMTDVHLENTIKMLRRQIDGSLHDDFCYDNIISMENELNRRKRKMKIQNVDLKVVGVTFTNEDTGEKRGQIIRELADSKKPEEISIELVREKNNQYDMNAVKVMADGRQIGYIGKEYAAIIAPLMDELEEFNAVVKGIGEFKNRPYCEITINQL